MTERGGWRQRHREERREEITQRGRESERTVREGQNLALLLVGLPQLLEAGC